MPVLVVLHWDLRRLLGREAMRLRTLLLILVCGAGLALVSDARAGDPWLAGYYGYYDTMYRGYSPGYYSYFYPSYTYSHQSRYYYEPPPFVSSYLPTYAPVTIYSAT